MPEFSLSFEIVFPPGLRTATNMKGTGSESFFADSSEKAISDAPDICRKLTAKLAQANNVSVEDLRIVNVAVYEFTQIALLPEVTTKAPTSA